MIQNKQVYKTKITSDESKEIPSLQLEKDVTPKKGCIVLATFFRFKWCRSGTCK